MKIMDSLLKEWMDLFDYKKFEKIEAVPEELKIATMLFTTLKNEFRRIEMSLCKKMESFQSTYESSKLNIKSVASSPPAENTSEIENMPNTKTLLKSPTLRRHRKKQNLKKTKQCNLFSYPPSLQSLTNSNIHTPKILKDDNSIFSDKLEDNDILDCSIIATTPMINIKKSRIKMISPRKRMKSVSMMKDTNITQINKIDVTKKNTEDESSMMAIDEIISKIDDTETQLNMPENVNVSSFVADYDKLPPVISNSPKKKFVFKETVRGNEKKKLKGWSCKDCENFYKFMNLTEKELEKKMDECSKHRSRFKPDEETIAGYWDLSIPPTPEDQNYTSAKEESIGNNSTIFCLYKN